MKKAASLLFLISLINIAFAQSPQLVNSLRKHVYFLASDSLLGRRFGSVDAWKANQYIINEFQTAGIKPFSKNDYLQPFEEQGIGGYNVVGIIESENAEAKDQYIVLGAHYDHLGWKLSPEGEIIVYNGADDNASGVSVLLELGKELMLRKKELKKSIILVAFDGEEQGLYGSTYFVKSKIVNLDSIKCMFSIDMVGMYRSNEELIINDVGTMKNGVDYFKQNFAGDTTIKLDIKKKDLNPFTGTDSDPFSDAGVPGIHIFTGTLSPYHQPNDDAGLLDYEGMANIVNFMTKVTINLSNNDNIAPEKVKKETTGQNPNFAFGLNFGIGSGHYTFTDEFFKSKNLTAFSAGMYANIRLVKNWLWLQPEVAFESTGGEYRSSYSRDYSVSVPLSLRFVRELAPGISPFATLGGYYKYHLAQHFKPSAEVGTLNRYDYGIVWSFGMKVFKVSCGLSFKYDLSESLTDAVYGNANSRTTLFFMQYQF